MKEILPYGDSAALINFDNEIEIEIHFKVCALYQSLRQEAKRGIISLIPAYNSITVVYNPLQTNFKSVKNLIDEVWLNTDIAKKSETKTIIDIPVCYDLDYALDSDEVVDHTGLSFDKVIEQHSSQNYLVYMTGFTPGFMYLGGLSESIATPRKKVPRKEMPKGSVAIGGSQTGVYPLATPGGWNIIGQTPIDLLPFKQDVVIEMGEYIHFFPITKDEFLNQTYRLKKRIVHGN